MSQLDSIQVGQFRYDVQWWKPGDPVHQNAVTLATDTETELLIKGSAIKPVIAQVCDHRNRLIQVVHWLLWDEYFAQLRNNNPAAIWIFHNAAFDIEVLGDPRLPENRWMLDLIEQQRVVDTGIRFSLHQLSLGKFQGRWGLDYAAKLMLGIEVDKGKSKGKDAERLTFRQYDDAGNLWAPTFDHITYAAIDAAITAQLFEEMPTPYPTEHTCFVGNIALDDISRRGLLIDAERRDELRSKYVKRIADLERDLHFFGWNPGSGNQNDQVTQDIMAWLEEEEGIVLPRTAGSKKKDAYTDEKGVRHEEVPAKPGKIKMTDAALEVLKIEHNFIKRYKEYKHETKILSTYLTENQKDTQGNEIYERVGTDGRVHPYFKGMVKTGRTSCSQPNIQNVPRADGVRGIYTAKPGHLLFACDYSQAELCALAQHCYTTYGFSKMLEVINDDVDLHRWLGERIFYKERGMSTEVVSVLSNFAEKSKEGRLALGDVINAEIIQAWIDLSAKEKKEYRQLSKALNFGAPGGLGAPTFVDFAKGAYGVVLTVDQAKELIDFWKNVAFPEIKHHLSPEGDGKAWGENEHGEKESYTVYKARTITGRLRSKASYCSACNYALTVAHIKPSEFGGSQLTSLACNYVLVTGQEVIPSEALQECKERVTTSAWSPERAVKHHERPARRNAVMI
jgi:hypothetical protein